MLKRYLTTSSIKDKTLSIGNINHSWKIRDNYSKSKIPYGWFQGQSILQGNNSKLLGDQVTVDNQEILRHLRWMLQKDKLGTDMFLIGTPSPIRRWLAMTYAQLADRDVEYVAITRDTTESDLKQRREIIKGSALFVNQAPVRAALNGSLLILDGIEKAERNVLPTLNNLLENREMHLDDGRFIMEARRYDSLENAPTHKQLLRAHPNFRVIALGVPVPPFKGKPLDPPLRSRFSCRVVNPLQGGELWSELALAVSKTPQELETVSPKTHPRLLTLTSVSSALLNRAETVSKDKSNASVGAKLPPPFPQSGLPITANLVNQFSNDSIVTYLNRLYPFFGTLSLSREFDSVMETCRLLVEDKKNELTNPSNLYTTSYAIRAIRKSDKPDIGIYEFVDSKNHTVTMEGPTGPFFTDNESILHQDETRFEGHTFTALPIHEQMLTAMMQDHCGGRDIAIVGEPGSGKSQLAMHFAKALGYNVNLFSLYKDMSARDLLQRRTTDAQGNTGWDYSPLVRAAIDGDMVILDGLDRLDPETLTVIHRLVVDREADLFDGKRLRKAPTSCAKNTEDEDCLFVHPRFKVVSLVSVRNQAGTKHIADTKWLTPEFLSMFSVHVLDALSPADQELLIQKCFPNVPPEFLRILREYGQAAHGASDDSNTDKKKKTKSKTVTSQTWTTPVLSTRQVMRLARFAATFPDRALPELEERLKNILLAQYLPQTQRQSFDELLRSLGVPVHNGPAEEIENIPLRTDGETLTIGDVHVEVNTPTHPELVPHPVFYDIPKHKLLMRDLLEDMSSGEKHILLIGNQGVGKNKIADRLLQLLQKEREYIQLHRDSTVGSLTLSPSLIDGIVKWEDSPLVRAATLGRTLLCDEVDKAPVEVVSVLKSLVEDHEMLLADGRRLVSGARFTEMKKLGTGENLVPIHPSFSMIVLANRPGFPFLGNDFFREIGDIFCTHSVSNPDTESEVQLLKHYAPNVNEGILRKLVASFNGLRELVDQGVLVYPYSTREAVAVVRHMEAYPDDGLVNVLHDVLGFDSFNPHLMETVAGVFHKNGIPISIDAQNEPVSHRVLLGQVMDLPEPIVTEKWKK